MKATRDSFGEELAVLGEKNPEIVVLDADLSKSTKSNGFAKKFPNRFFEMGIAEANMIGTAAGLALSGKTSFACSFGCFLTGRYDQIRMSVSYNRANVKLIVTHSGVAIGEDGHSQMGLEDVALLRSLPEFEIFQPADDQETRAIIRYVVKNNGPCYIRLTRQKVPDIYKTPFEFVPGKWSELHKGKGIALIATGGLVGACVEANEKTGKKLTVVNAASLKPIDEKLIEQLANSHEWIVTAEDHYTTGGLGSAVAEVLASIGSKAKLYRIGVETFGESGSPEDVIHHFQLDSEGVLARLQKNVGLKI
ncbi:MAG: Transketolase [Bacteriovoracaceae bacterium]|nr:Transketolase [Bacteriovoracaceae bacterium]